MMNGRKTRKQGRREPGPGNRKKEPWRSDDSDRKHLTGREVERLIEATKGSRNEARDRCLFF
jgi:hypothetical protein